MRPRGIEISCTEEEFRLKLKTVSCEVEEYFFNRLVHIDSRTDTLFQLRGVFVQENLDIRKLIRGVEQFLNGLQIVATTCKRTERLIVSITDQNCDVSQLISQG